MGEPAETTKVERNRAMMSRLSAPAAFAIGIVVCTPSHALLPPPTVECCNRKDYTSEQCARFKLDEAVCVKAVANFNETFLRLQAINNPKPAVGGAETKATDGTEAKPAAAPQGKAATKDADFTIDRVEARLYYQHSGTFSAPITKDMRFWNVIIGEGGAKEPSSTLRVDVVLKGKPGDFKEDAKISVEFVNAETGKRLTQQTAMAGGMSPRGTYHAMFMLHPAGCIPLKINAQLTGKGLMSAKSIDVPFNCGE
ncbi:MAG: hypothetical protein JNJ55_09400 [Betaproteobacteria bacterium]|nr:hypothetical protein [Betaproteobacteria bacterium]